MNANPKQGLVAKNCQHALVVSNSDETVDYIKQKLTQIEIATVVAHTEEQAHDLLSDKFVSYILIDADLAGNTLSNLISALRDHIGDQYVPIMVLATSGSEDRLSYYISSGCDDVLFNPFTLLSLNAKIISHEKIGKLKLLYKGCENEQIVAQRILSNAIGERSIHFDDIDILNISKSIFSGDLFLTARHPDGSLNILIADFTGHGLSAAISGLPVADVFKVMTEKGFELTYILENINSKLHTLLPTYMFMACSALNISIDLKTVKTWNGGMPDIYIRESRSGRINHKIKSTHLPLGIAETAMDQYKIESFAITPGDQLILFTDGLTEAANNEGEMFGDICLDKCLQNNQHDKSIFPTLISTFDDFRGDVDPMDDITLVCVPCIDALMQTKLTDISNKRIQSSKYYG